MVTLSKKELQKIVQEVEREFPDDPALQQVHIARKIIACKADLSGISFLDYMHKRECEQPQ